MAGNVVINTHAFETQENKLNHLAAAIEGVGDRVLQLSDLVETSREEDQDKLGKEIGDLWAILHCLSAVADSVGTEVARWRAWANRENISIT